MPQALRQSLPDDADGWLSVDQAARLTGEPKRTWSWRAQQEANQARSQARESLAIKVTIEGRTRWMIHRSIDDHLSVDTKRDDNCTATALLENHPQHFVDRGLQRNRWLQRWKRACAAREDGLSDNALASRVVDEAKREDQSFKISVRSLYNWRKALRVSGVAGLVDKHTGPGERSTRSAEATEYFYTLYRTENKLSAEECHRFTLAESNRSGWDWPETATSTRTWLSRHDDLAYSYLLRYGKTAYQHRYMPHLTMNWGAIAPGHMYVADHKQCDFFVQSRKKPIRPWLTAVMDCRSRLIVGWHLGPKPHTESILCAFQMAFREYGLPAKMKIDNGKDFTCQAITGATKDEVRQLQRIHGREWRDVLERNEHLVDFDDKRWVGVLAALNVEVKLARPYEPWSKPIERWFGTFGEQCAKHFATWCGDKPENKPESLPEILAGKLDRDANGLRLSDESMVPTMDHARESIRAYIEERYNVQPHSGRGVDGRTPMDVWRTAAHTIRRADDETLALVIGTRGAYKVGANGVRVIVGGAPITYGRRCKALWRYKGRKVLVSVDPVKPQFAYALDADTRRLIGKLDPDEAIHPDANTDDVRENIADTKRDQSIMHKARRSSARRNRTLVQRINAGKKAERAACRATGTDDATATISVHQTGFEGASKAVRSTVEPRVPGPYDHITMDDLVASLPDAPEEPDTPSGQSIWHRMVESNERDKENDDFYDNLNLDHTVSWLPEEDEESDEETDGEG